MPILETSIPAIEVLDTFLSSNLTTSSNFRSSPHTTSASTQGFEPILNIEGTRVPISHIDNVPALHSPTIELDAPITGSRVTVNYPGASSGTVWTTTATDATFAISCVYDATSYETSDYETSEAQEKRRKTQLRQVMKSNLLFDEESFRQPSLNKKITPQETKARNTLRDLISERVWRKYLTNGFVIIPAKSGKFYQVFNDQRHIRVYVKGKLSDEICIHTEGCPPTDHILNIMMMIHNDEQLLWTEGISNVYPKGNNQDNLYTELNPNAGVIFSTYGRVIYNDDGTLYDALVDHLPKKLSLVETYKKMKEAA